jgi:hypothetical protein
MAVVPQVKGNYLFLPATTDSPYSSGAIAMPGFEVVHATLRTALPWREGFAFVEKHLASLGRPRQALCAVELRCAEPYPPGQWVGPGTFNGEYLKLLEGWEIFVDGLNPVARTNVAPVVAPPAGQTLHGFSYTVPTSASGGPPTFVVAGAAEIPSVRRGETSVDALREKTASVMDIMQARLFGLGAGWSDVTDVGVYTIHDFHSYLVEGILNRVGPAASRGIHWYNSRPPISDREMEIDLRGIRTEVRV